MKDFIPYGRHTIDQDDIDAVASALKSDALTAGPKVAAFETAFAEAVGAQEAVVCANGTAALHLAVLASGLQPGDKAIVPTITFLATANAVRMAGGDVVFADVDPKSGLMTAETLEVAMREAGGPVKVVLPVHLNGQACDMEAIKSVVDDHAVPTIITDCCHALGGRYQDGGAPGDGQYERMGCFSLHPVKAIAMGEGGVVTTNDKALAKRLRLLRSHDMHRQAEDFIDPGLSLDDEGNPNPWSYEMQALGYNYRANDIQCALGLSQLGKLDHFASERRKIAGYYDQLFEGLNFVEPIHQHGFSVSGWHLYPILIRFDELRVTRAALMNTLRERGIGSQVHYIPVHRQPYYQQLYGGKLLPGAEKYYQSVLSIPIYPGLTQRQQDYVVKSIREVTGQ